MEGYAIIRAVVDSVPFPIVDVSIELYTGNVMLGIHDLTDPVWYVALVGRSVVTGAAEVFGEAADACAIVADLVAWKWEVAIVDQTIACWVISGKLFIVDRVVSEVVVR